MSISLPPPPPPLPFSTHSPDKVYHVTVMPCYDKKLEASREDFYSDLYRTRDVDCVLTSGEVTLGSFPYTSQW